MVEDKIQLEFEARYYLAESKRLQKQGHVFDSRG